MSPSSSPRGGPAPPRRLGLAALLGFLFAALAPAGAQQQALYAVLLEGPHPVRDLRMYPPNPLKAQAGEYSLGEARLTVLYTREPLVLPQAWRPRACGTVRLLEVTGHEPYSLCYADPQGAFTLFFSFPDGPEEALRCRFVESFVRRVQVLRDLLREESEVPFPGVLEISRP